MFSGHPRVLSSLLLAWGQVTSPSTTLTREPPVSPSSPSQHRIKRRRSLLYVLIIGSMYYGVVRLVFSEFEFEFFSVIFYGLEKNVCVCVCVCDFCGLESVCVCVYILFFFVYCLCFLMCFIYIYIDVFFLIVCKVKLNEIIFSNHCSFLPISSLLPPPLLLFPILSFLTLYLFSIFISLLLFYLLFYLSPLLLLFYLPPLSSLTLYLPSLSLLYFFLSLSLILSSSSLSLLLLFYLLFYLSPPSYFPFYIPPPSSLTLYLSLLYFLLSPSPILYSSSLSLLFLFYLSSTLSYFYLPLPSFLTPLLSPFSLPLPPLPSMSLLGVGDGLGRVMVWQLPTQAVSPLPAELTSLQSFLDILKD